MQTVLISNSSIWLIDRTLSGATTPGPSGPKTNGNEMVLHIPQNSKTEASRSDYFISYPVYPLGMYYSSAELHLVYTACPLDWIITLRYIYYDNVKMETSSREKEKKKKMKK